MINFLSSLLLFLHRYSKFDARLMILIICHLEPRHVTMDISDPYFIVVTNLICYFFHLLKRFRNIKKSRSTCLSPKSRARDSSFSRSLVAPNKKTVASALITRQCRFLINWKEFFHHLDGKFENVVRSTRLLIANSSIVVDFFEIESSELFFQCLYAKNVKKWEDNVLKNWINKAISRYCDEARVVWFMKVFRKRLSV